MVFLVVVLLLASARPALAFRVPVGAVASQEKLTERSARPSLDTGKYDVSYVPLLLDLARVMGRYQPRPGFFLYNAPYSNHPGLDLRWLLFRQSSPLSLDGLTGPANGLPPNGDSPTLRFPAIGDKAEPPADARKAPEVPQLAVRPLPADIHSYPPNESRARVGSPEQVSLSVRGNELNNLPSVLMVDFQSLSAALNSIGDPGSRTLQTAWETPVVRSILAPPLPVPHPPKGISREFMLWTLVPATESGAREEPQAGHGAGTRPPSAAYSGTFVACLHGTRFKALKPRYLSLQQGRLLAGNRGEDLVFDTEFGQVRLETGASALIDVSDRGLLRVTVLESEEGAQVSVTREKSGTGNQLITLSRGEELLLSGREISAGEIQPADGIQRTATEYAGTVARTRVSLSDLLAREKLLDPTAKQLTERQRSALVQLRDSLKDR
jgi:hypothetical protein